MSRFLALLACALLAPQALAADAPLPAPPLEQSLPGELEVLEQALGGRMGVALFRTDDPVVQSYIAAGILHVPAEAYVRLEAGLASVTVLAGKHNGRQRPMCYVLFNPSRAGSSIRAFYLPLAQITGHPRWGAAYLAAHEVGHCLDHLQRDGAMARQATWDASQAQAIGVQPDAFERTFGPRSTTASYQGRQDALYADRAQRQYEERVADAFGVLWAEHLGAGAAVRTLVREVRARDAERNAHATAPVLDQLPASGDAVAASAEALWAMARQAQRAAGVDPSLGPGSRVAVDAAPSPRAMTFAGPAAAEAKVPSPAPAGVAWDQLPRFGRQR